ncbi:MAG: leucine-rich repeat domain-containing protein [bacterium]
MNWMLCVLVLCAVTSSAITPDYTYITNNGSITITGYIGTNTAVTITNKINGLTVSCIGDSSFQYKTSLTSVTIPSSVVRIGNSAFSTCYNLTNVTFGSNVSTIGNDAFYYCPGLAQVQIPNSVTNIGDRSFKSCYGIGPSVQISSNVNYIGPYAFADCGQLVTITVNAVNSRYSSTNGVLFNSNKTTLIQYPGGKGGTYVVPNSVTRIEDGAFYSCQNLSNVIIGTNATTIGANAFYYCGLTNISIGTNVYSIGDTAFYQCSSLIFITIPSGVTNIGYCAFKRCDSLAVISVDPQNHYYSSTNGILFDKGMTLLIQCPAKGNVSDYAIPDGVTNIANYAFYDPARNQLMQHQLYKKVTR